LISCFPISIRSPAISQEKNTRMDLKLRGRTALITGASRGIGFATAAVLADEGCNLVLVARTAATLNAARQSLITISRVSVTVHALDISKSSSIARLAAEHPDLDILVNNAGAVPAGRLGEIDEKRWRDAWELKVFGYINMTRAFYAAMKKRGSGVIINIIGVAGERHEAGYIAGSAGNAALMAFTRAMGSASPADNIRIIGVNPGPIATDRLNAIMKKRAQDLFGDASRWREMYTALPFGRAGKPEEIAHMVAFLASDLSAYISGTVITIDAGASNRGRTV
jgi:NAD(P)-dependent dehydrogenase (short-subunit alcohol dehydrogenase family)